MKGTAYIDYTSSLVYVTNKEAGLSKDIFDNNNSLQY